MAVDANKIVNSVFEMIEDRTRNRTVINKNLPLVAQNTINDVKTYWNVSNTSLEKNIVDKVVMYTEQKDDYEVYRTYAKALINDQFVVSKEINDAVTEIYNWYKGKKFTDRTADVLAKVNSGYAPSIKIDSNGVGVKIGSILDIQIGNTRKPIFEMKGDSTSKVELSGEVVVNYNNVRNGSTTLATDINRINNELNSLKNDVNELRKADARLAELLNEYKNSGILDGKFATKTDLDKVMEEHVNSDYKHITQEQVDLINTITDIRSDLDTHISNIAKYHLTESEMNHVRDILKIGLRGTIEVMKKDIEACKAGTDSINTILTENKIIKTEYLPFNLNDVKEEITNSLLDVWDNIQKLNNLHPDSNVHVTEAERKIWNAKYTKPNDGIPMKDLSKEILDRLDEDGYIFEIWTATKSQINRLFN